MDSHYKKKKVIGAQPKEMMLEAAPKLSLPLRHFIMAAVSFWVFSLAFLLSHNRLLGFDFQARWVLGMVHVLTLGWVTMTILGALSQMAFVFWQVPLHSGVVAWAWWLFLIGFVGFVGHLWIGLESYWIPAIFLALSVGLYLYTLIRTMIKAKKLDWTGKHLVFSIGYFLVLVILGILLAWDRQRGILFPDPEGALIAHVHLALIGWASLAIFGVSYRLVSMFALSHGTSKTSGRLTLVFLNAGLFGLVLDSLFFGRHFTKVWASLLFLAYLFYVYQMKQVFQSRHRKLDPSLSFTIVALTGGFVWALLGLSLAFGWIQDSTENRSAYIFMALLGWMTPYILGQIHKIIPFLIWFHVYSPRRLKPPNKLPTIQDLTSPRLAWIELSLLVPAIFFGVAGFMGESKIFLGLSSLLLLTVATLYIINTGRTLRHLVRKDPRWIQQNC